MRLRGKLEQGVFYKIYHKCLLRERLIKNQPFFLFANYILCNCVKKNKSEVLDNGKILKKPSITI